MKKLAFVFAGAAVLTISACSSRNDDAVNNAELNQPAAEDLNAIANEAAMNADEQALGNRQKVEDQNASATLTNNTADTSDADEQNVSGM